MLRKFLEKSRKVELFNGRPGGNSRDKSILRHSLVNSCHQMRTLLFTMLIYIVKEVQEVRKQAAEARRKVAALQADIKRMASDDRALPVQQKLLADIQMQLSELVGTLDKMTQNELVKMMDQEVEANDGHFGALAPWHVCVSKGCFPHSS